LGKMDVSCTSCQALHWIDERCVGSPVDNPVFGSCCMQGKVQIDFVEPIPNELRRLYEGSDQQAKEFHSHI
ncbi:hypothetical protein EDB83DRAFT_2179945, partial [Lactarius deliciosus]